MTNVNAMTVDVEEYFQVEAFAQDISVNEWSSYESRLHIQMERLLTTFAQNNVKATFFTLGWIAEAHPELLKKLVSEGHEVASHGFMHQHLSKQNADVFYEDITKAKKLIEDITGTEVKGYRAPCFSISADNDWAHDLIAKAGYKYSSSSYPINHDLYGVPKAPRDAYRLSNGLLEIPVTTATIGDKILPAGGGGYFRLLPFWMFNYLFNKGQKGRIGNFYTHPWEFDPEQPRIESNMKSRFRHHVNQKTAMQKLAKLCASYNWTSMEQAYLGQEHPVLGDWPSVANGLYTAPAV
ncbi:XrtA system polysaccharide deacetylase [Alteromonas lipotrueiana]|uniref:XrtA system polysaccharide deacetylase n=1 Tax=Alteromonas lipotrueiana TaxID=2803815 RepID=UPI001C495725|nr:XrtA system polysaccharide deacetylase [Alteromonas lipotrueiana]|tara:strand:- start:95 stop:979 length:885 start_codon:yes stop_codon:yes gene_type:complete